ncbi:MAG: ABC transporter ATP-binding protein [Candidatus Sungbacteria bacterium]|nr:ABC transporter ATP-binding protein [Candidatus Sungbacteria bacterium]
MENKKIDIASLKELAATSGRVFRMIVVKRKLLFACLGTLYFLASVAPFARSGIFGLFLDELVTGAALHAVSQRLALAVAALVAISALAPLVFALQNHAVRLAWFFTQEIVEMTVMRRRAELDMATLESPATNDLLNRVDENGIWRTQNFTDRMFALGQNAVEVALASAILSVADWRIFLVIVAGALPQLWTELRYGSDVWTIHGGRAEIRRRFYHLRWHFSWLPSLTEIKLFQNAKHFLAIVRDLFRAFQNEEKQSERRRIIRELGAIAFSQAAIAVATLWFIGRVLAGELTIGVFTFLVASIAGFNQALSSLFSNLGRQYQDGLFVADVFRVLDLAPALSKPGRTIRLNREKTPEIVFENVSFAYPGAERLALKNISLAIGPGQKLALVGANGSGKTTLVKLLCRFYDPTRGRILLNGADLREIDLDDWYAMLGILFQDYANYHFLVKESIALGRTNHAPAIERIKEAAQASEADAFIEEWEKKYEQVLGKQFAGGIEPSIGQWQKLALARTFYRDPRVLILDEPTASIDAESEANIFDKIEALPRDRSVILISHRFSTVRHADRIAVIEEGAVTELGSHEELLDRNQTYARLFRLQAKGYA